VPRPEGADYHGGFDAGTEVEIGAEVGTEAGGRTPSLVGAAADVERDHPG